MGFSYFETVAGHRFTEETIPDLIRAINDLNKNLSSLDARLTGIETRLNNISEKAEKLDSIDSGIHGLIEIEASAELRRISRGR